MTPLKNTAIAIGLIILLAITQIILNKLSPQTAVFHDLLIRDYQLAILLWIVMFLLLKPLFKKNLKPRHLIISLAVFFLASDILFQWMLTHPTYIPAFCKKTFKDYYTSYQRNILQYETCSEYDTAFFYRLKPNASFSFKNIEFDNEFSSNSLGMRDSDSALSRPEIVFLGDSYTLGWGVNQQQTFAAVTSALTGKKVLNTSMSSYGTAREIKWLSKIDTSAVRYVVIQYCKNDIGENEVFNEHNILPISPSKAYEDARTTYTWKRKYFPGKCAITMLYAFAYNTLRDLIKGSSAPYYRSNDPIASAGEFVKVLNTAPLNTQKIKILVIDLNDFNELNNMFLKSVDSLLQQPAYARLANSVQTIDLSTALSASDFYILDAHLKPSGHTAIAKVLASYIK